ncbi:thioether cross-link-forming SCIFF peptide maturase [Candidatus Epulonipiscium viviparus]|uniref:thioether cross-link-forming SCIFF peptide maturase n=1 Tax=Candidatus Epulonipiscium viviparus TaxID=420336 RepID=UPI00273807A6|nr:thioether cross-link-forming SCIFF peptide maturase [Candidatus Epulopiscium viviparus]
MIHKFKFDGLNIVMDINSGAIHVVDDIVYDLVLEIPKLTADEITVKYAAIYDEKYIREAIDEINELISEQILYTEDTYENLIPAFLDRKPIVKALCLHVAHDCNLGCKYCFAGEGEYHGPRGLMSVEVGKRAIDFLIESSGVRTNLEVDFFGGEPLMNFKVVRELVDYANSRAEQTNKKFRFTLTTNGVLLNDQIIDFLNEYMDNVVLSLDGRPEINDQMRPTANGKGSYDIILPKFKKLVEKRGGKKYYIRGTFTHKNLDFAKDVLHIAELGFNEVSVEPVVAPRSKDYAIKEDDIALLCQEYEILAKEMLKRYKQDGEVFNFFHFNIDLTGGPCVYKRLSGCGSGTEYLAVTPEGNLYPCHQFVGIDEFAMGNVWDGVTNLDRRSEFGSCNVYQKDECKKCFAKFFCSGGCAANSYNFNGNILGTYEIGCQLQKSRLENAIGLIASKQQ